VRTCVRSLIFRMFVSRIGGRGERSLARQGIPAMRLRSPARGAESGGEAAERGRSARNRYVAPCFRVTGTGWSFRRRRQRSARPVHTSRRRAGFKAACGAFRIFPDPDLFAAFSPVRRTPVTGGRRPGLPGSGVSTPRTVRPPHAALCSASPASSAAQGSGRRLQDDVSRSIAPRRTWLALAPDALPRDGMAGSMSPPRGSVGPMTR